MVGPPALHSCITIHFGTDDLRSMIAERPGVLHFTMEPGANGVFIAHGVDREWVFIMTYVPTEESADADDEGRCAQIVRTSVGHPEAAVEILSTGIFLTGDAAHKGSRSREALVSTPASPTRRGDQETSGASGEEGVEGSAGLAGGG